MTISIFTRSLIVLIFISSGVAHAADMQFMLNTVTSHEPVVYIFAHGLGANRTQGPILFAHVVDGKSSKVNDQWIIHEPYVTFNFPDAMAKAGEYERDQVNLGQAADMERLHEVYTAARSRFPGYKIVLVGISRGSATIINYVAHYKPDDIAALVLESPFDSLTSIVRHLLERFNVHWLPFAQTLGFKICQTHFPQVNPEGIFPIASIDQIPHTLPVILIHARGDKVVPINSSRQLYCRLVERGHRHAYLIELSAGLHGKLIRGEEKETYLHSIHAFYKKYNLPHTSSYAEKGAYLLRLAQPTPTLVKVRMRRRDELVQAESAKPTNLEIAFHVTKNAIK
ncbi:MAG: hypothetical protein WCE21_02340 [Candidatus Babeliales bacterium]